ncbi:MAG TPA: patatin-like phospholipase family protein [Acidimicrobiia bacterium]|nr:patatin-like phospholipase family protein [Acidimicrobiia bacterium]
MTTAFVLGGGGKWGAVEVGMIQALDEVGIVPDLILGTSIGAFNGAVIADYPGQEGVERLKGFWEEVTGADLFQTGFFDRAVRVATLKPAIHETGELRALIEHAIHPDTRIEDLQIRYQCVAASIENTTERWFDSGSLIDAVLASSAVPALFPPVEIDGEHFYDGGLVDSVPLGRAVELGADRVYVLQVGRIESPLRVPERLYEAALISFEIARRHRFTTTMRNLPDGVEVHLLPTGSPVAWDDRSQLRWKDTGGIEDRMTTAYYASLEYLHGREEE